MSARPSPTATSVDLDAVRTVSQAVSAAHLFIYLVPEATEEATGLGVTQSRPAYFAFRSAALGAVPWQVTAATFYNFRPRAVREMDGVWDLASPERWQAARFAAAERALRRVGVALSDEQVSEARDLLGRVVAAADYAGKPLAAANASLAPPTEPLTALWQQVTVVREWRGDAHIGVLVASGLGPCECNVMHTATGRLPTAIVRTTRGWTDAEWTAATERLIAHDWLDRDGSPTRTGAAAREQVEVDTDERCAELWAPVGADGARRLAELLAPVSAAFTAAGTFGALR